MGENIKTLYNVISPLINHPDESVCCLAIEIWTTIATEDTDLGPTSLKLISKIGNQLMILLLQNLVRQPQNDDLEDEDEQNIQTASSKCLSHLVEVIKDEALDTFQKFISNTI